MPQGPPQQLQGPPVPSTTPQRTLILPPQDPPLMLPPSPPGTPGHKCGSTKHRIISPKVERGGGGAAAAAEPPKAAPSSPDTTQPSPGLGGAPAEGPPPFPSGLPLLVVANLGGAAPGGPENPLGLTPSQHLVTPEGSCPTALPHGAVGLPHAAPPAAFDPDCFLNSPRRGQTYGCEAEAPPGAPPPPPEAPPKLGGDEEEEEGVGAALPAPPRDLAAAVDPQPPFALPFAELLAGDGGVPPTPREPPPTPRTPPSPPAPPDEPPVAITDFSPEWSYPEVSRGGGQTPYLCPPCPPCVGGPVGDPPSPLFAPPGWGEGADHRAVGRRRLQLPLRPRLSASRPGAAGCPALLLSP